MAQQPADPYAVLGVDRDASPEEIRAAYRRLASEHHPDRFAGASPREQEDAAERMTALNAAWEILGSPERRKQYDHATAEQRHRLFDLAATLGPGFGLQLWGSGGISTRLSVDAFMPGRPPMKGERRYITAWAEDLSPLRKLYPEEVSGLWLLHGREAGDEALDHIAALPWLHVLDLRDTSVTSLGVGKLQGFDKLWSLNLSGTLINDRAMETISTMRSLQELSLVDTAVTEHCVPQLLTLEHLRVLNLKGTKLSDHAVREIATLPSLEILSAPGRVSFRTSLWARRHRRNLWIG